MEYYKFGKAFKDITSAIGAKETAIAGAKLVGKTLFNVGKLATDVAVEIVKHAPVAAERSSSDMLKRTDLTNEQREKAEGLHASAEKMIPKIIDFEIKQNRKRLVMKGISTEELNEIREEIASLESKKRSLESDKRWS